MDTIQLITEISVLKKKMDKAEAFLEELVEYLLVTCKDDDYITPEVICRKLAKYGYIELENGYWVNPLAGRKTENRSEKPNNCKAQMDYDKGLQLFADILFDKEKSEQFLKECEAMGIEPQTDVYDYKGNGKWERSE